jgi:outer membrane receptor for ferrienterochelin and colicins
MSSNLNLHTSIAKAYRGPTFNELYWPHQDFGDWGEYEGNPDLGPESTVAYETGLRYLDSGFKGELNLFKRDVDYLIDWSAGLDGVNRPYNINSAEIKGVEMILTRQLTDDFTVDFDYTYLDARDKETDKQLNDRPYHTANVSFSYDQEKFNANLSGKLVGERQDGSTQNMLPSYFVVDFNTSKEINNDLELILEINNLFDKDYEASDGYPMPGRNYMLKLNKKF